MSSGLYIVFCRPTLGANLSKVLAAGAIYGVFSFLDGITRSYSVSNNYCYVLRWFDGKQIMYLPQVIGK